MNIHAIDNLTPMLAEAAARAPEIEQGRRLPADLARKFAAAGLFRLLVPRDCGGLELPPAEALAAIEAMGAADAASGWCVMIAATTGLNAAFLPLDSASAIFGPDDAICGGIFAPMGRAVAEGDGFRLSGRWQWGSGSANCDWLFGGALVQSEGAPPVHRMFGFPAHQAVLHDTWHASGLRGTGSGDMEVRDILVPKDRVIDLIGGVPRAQGALYRFPVFGLLALGIAAVMLGNARGAIRDLCAMAGAKKPPGAQRSMADRGAVQSAVAIAEAQLRSARAFVQEAVEEAWASALAGDEIPLPQRAALRLAATHATRTSADVARAMYDLGGGSSVFEASPLQRRFRDAHVGTQHLMVQAQTYELTGRVLLDRPVDAAQI